MWKPAYDFLLTWAAHVGDSYRDVIQELHLGLDKMRNPITKRWKHLTGTLILVNCLDTLRSAAFCPTGYGDFAVWILTSNRRRNWLMVKTAGASQCCGNYGTDWFSLSRCKWRILAFKVERLKGVTGGPASICLLFFLYSSVLPHLFFLSFCFFLNKHWISFSHFIFCTLFLAFSLPASDLFLLVSHLFQLIKDCIICCFSICSFKFTLRITLETSATAGHYQTYCELQPFPHLGKLVWIPYWTDNSISLHF